VRLYARRHAKLHRYADCSLQLGEHTDEMVSGPGTGVQDDRRIG
jgi:hypothetical protein